MAAVLHNVDQRRLIDSNGISDGASIAFYLTGTTTPATIYSDVGLATPLTNPVVVGAGAAVPNIYLDDAVTYRRVITYSDGSTDDTDPYTAPYVSSAVLATSSGSSLVGFIQAGTGAVARTAQAKMRDFVSVKDFGAVGDGVADDTAAIQAAIDHAGDVGGAAIHIPAGTYKVTDTLEINSSNVTLYGDGGSTVVKAYDATGAYNWTQLGIIVANIRLSYTQTSDRISNINLHSLVVDQSNVTTGYFAAPSSRRLWGSAIGARFVDNISVRNVRVIDGITSGISLRGCFNQSVEGCTVYGLRVVRAGVDYQVYGGNAIEMGAHYDGDTNTYTGPYGCGRVVNNTVVGSDEVSFPGTIVNYVLDTCNIGIQTQVGSYSPVNRQEQQIVVSHNTVRRCFYGILQEGQNAGGAGDGIVNSNDVQDCFFGISQLASAASGPTPTTDNAYSGVISNNRISNVYLIGIQGFGNGLNITGNVVTNWGTALNAAPFTSLPSSLRRAHGIYVCPTTPGTTFSGVCKGSLVANNVLQNRYVNSSSYWASVAGITAITDTSSRVWENVQIIGNNIDGGNATYSTGTYDSGIVLLGLINESAISDNIVTGFARRAVYVAPYYSQAMTNTGSLLSITSNRLIDNGWANSSSSAVIQIDTQNSGYYIANNLCEETSGTRMFAAVLIPQESGVNTAANEITIRGNKIRGMQYGNQQVLDLKITGTAVIIENNEDYNYRSAAPTSASYKNFARTIIYNSAPASAGYIGWVCTAAGSPGTWVTYGLIS
jgi:hypothetical protein